MSENGKKGQTVEPIRTPQKPAPEPLRGFPTTREIDDALKRAQRIAYVPAPVTIIGIPKSNK